MRPPVPAQKEPVTVQEGAVVVRNAMHDLQDDALLMLNDFTERTGLLVPSIVITLVPIVLRDPKTRQDIHRTEYRLHITTRLPR